MSNHSNPANTIVGKTVSFPYGGATNTGCVTDVQPFGFLLVCTKPGTYFWVDDYTVV